MRDVIGHGRLLRRLGTRAARGEVAHAYGIFGPRSVGKRTVALRLAQTLVCATGTRGGCGACIACSKVERGTHPDVRLVTRAADKKLIGIEQIREMQADLALRPLEALWRVVIVDDAAELDQGQDALLKTLEEPPVHAVLILITTTPAALHETILSRVQPLMLRLVPTSEIAAALASRGIRDGERFAAAASGRPGIALSLAGGDALRAERERIEAELYRLIGSGLTDRFAWAAELSDDSDARRRAGAIDLRLGHWSELLRDAAVAARGDLARPLRPLRAAESRRLAETVGSNDLLGAALLVEKLRRDLAFNANARAMLELFALRLPYSQGLRAA
jgi:DNA polymerase III subunit delta'